jgi:ABC-type phosphate transport system ATPase subunit
VIVTDNLQQATPAAIATAIAFMFGGELVEHARTTGMFADPEDEPVERDVTEGFG